MRKLGFRDMLQLRSNPRKLFREQIAILIVRAEEGFN